MIEGCKVLIPGIGGSIGSELARQLVKKNQVYGIDINETAFFDLVEEIGIRGRVGDVADPNVFDDMVSTFGYPHFIFLASARKHVTPMEWQPEEAIKTNLLGTLNVIRFAKKVGARLVFISSDKAVNPESVMGCTKKLGEIMVRNAGGVSVRFGNVLGSQGSVIPLWQRAIDRGQPIKVTDERMRRYFMTIEEACELVIEAAEKGEPGDIYILKMGESVRIIDIAKRIIAESRKSIPIEMVGIRPGEKLEEILMTHNEKESAIETEKFYILKGN